MPDQTPNQNPQKASPAPRPPVLEPEVFPFATADVLCCFAFLWQKEEA